jgi:barstar (barnase inhibitor)
VGCGVTAGQPCQIDLDASKWKTLLDFYDALLSALGAPEWHGRSINALIDSMIGGDINKIEPPYIIRVRSTASLPKDLRDEIERVRQYLQKHRADQNAIRFEIDP